MRFLILPLFAAALMVGACASNTRSEPPATQPASEPLDTMSAEPEGEAQPTGMVTEAPDYAPGSQEALEAETDSMVHFAFDKAELRPEARRILRRQAGWLKANPGVEVTIEGHCDERGTREYNLALGERRANAVREYLIAQGVAGDRIETVSYGKERPIALGSNPEAWAKNRRAETVVEDDGAAGS